MSCKETLFGVVPEEWTVSTIGEVIELRQGLQISKKLRSDVKGEGYIPLLKITDLPNRVFSEYVKGVAEGYIANEDDIIYTRTGQVGLVYTGVNGCVHNNCFKVIPNREVLDRGYVYYYLKSDRMLQNSNNIASGSVQKDLTHKTFKTVRIAYPSIDKQKKIADILFSLDKKIELNNEMNKTLEEMAQTLFKRWFLDFEFPNEDGEPYKSSGGEMDESELGMIPKGWRIYSIDEVCDLNKSNYSIKEKWEYINYLDTANITNNKIDNIQKIDCENEKVPSRAKRKVERDSIVYSTVRPNQLHYGIIKNPIENMIVSTGFVVLDGKIDFIKNDIIYYWLIQDNNTELLQSIGETSTSTYPSIKPRDIGTMKLALPPKEIIKNLEEKFDKINVLIDELKREEKQLIKLRDLLLPKLMSGEIRVEDIEANL